MWGGWEEQADQMMGVCASEARQQAGPTMLYSVWSSLGLKEEQEEQFLTIAADADPIEVL